MSEKDECIGNLVLVIIAIIAIIITVALNWALENYPSQTIVISLIIVIGPQVALLVIHRMQAKVVTLLLVWEGALVFGFITSFFVSIGWMPLQIVIISPVIILFFWELLKWSERRLKEEKEAALAWESEDQLKELKEKLGKGVITQEEYEQKKKLLEKSEPVASKSRLGRLLIDAVVYMFMSVFFLGIGWGCGMLHTKRIYVYEDLYIYGSLTLFFFILMIFLLLLLLDMKKFRRVRNDVTLTTDLDSYFI